MNEKNIINESVQQTIQGTKRDDQDTRGGMGLLFMLGANANTVPPWWSRKRDEYLRNIVTESDHLAGALYNFSIKMRTIPLRIQARNESIKWHTSLAKEYESAIKNISEFGKGFDTFFSKWIDDYHCQDNGAFIEIIAEGRKDQPITSRVLSIAHLDSSKCIRTSDPLFPVIYHDEKSGKHYKLHYSRVSSVSQRPSPIAKMNEVGYCSISNVLNSANSMIDLYRYKQERVGSRPAEAFIITGGGLDPEDIKMAMNLQRAEDDNSSLSRYSRAVIAGSRSVQDPKFDIHHLHQMPEWFSEREASIIAMSVIAMGFGMDARELFPSLESGATKADAIISHIKQRGRGPGHVLSVMEHILNTKVLPSFLIAEFDYQDDTEDRQAAEIRNIRAQARQRDITVGVSSLRVERQKMLDNGEITLPMFEDLELTDGRLPEGVDVQVLFYSVDKDYKEWLGDVNENNWEEKENIISTVLINSRSEEVITKARRALAAIKARYHPDPIVDENGNVPIEIDDSYQSERYGRKLPVPPANVTDETQNYQEAE